MKNTKKEGQKGFSLVFLNPSSPRPASSSLGPPNNFMMKKPTRLGELIASKLSFNSPGRAAFAPSAHFPINRRAREAEGRFQGSEGEGIEEWGVPVTELRSVLGLLNSSVHHWIF